ncbi:hypothetical protein Leryth_006621 [Lithospermum erythrorhizon]|nr:hypothetical protein Leryth_006621 [Lithospermum erythrorhizon]
MHASPMEYKILPPKKRKLDRCILEENGTMYRSSEQGNTQCDSLPEINSFAPKTVHGVHRSQSQQLKIQSGDIKLDGTSLVLDAVGEQGKYSTIERRVSDFNENPHPESAQKYRKSYVANNSCYPDTALVKASQEGLQDTDAACESITKLLNSSVACSSDTEVFTVLMKGSDEDIDEFDCPSLPSHKAAPVASQKIWEGSMQFNPNTSVPILAFFKRYFLEPLRIPT